MDVTNPWLAPGTPAEPPSAPSATSSVAGSVGGPRPSGDQGVVAQRGPLRGSPVARLAPRGTGSVLDAGFEVMRFRFPTIATVTAAIVLPLYAIPAVINISRLGQVVDELDQRAPNPFASVGITPTSGQGIASLIAALGQGLALTLVALAVAHLVSSWLVGRDPTTRETLQFVARRGWVMAFAWLLTIPLKGLGLLACVVGVLAPLAMFLVLSPVVASEGLGPARSIGRCWRLSTRRFWSLVGLTLASMGVNIVFSLIIAAVQALLLSQLVGGKSWAWIVLSAFSVAFALLMMPIQAGWAAIAYLDLRVRTEGLDLDLDATELLPRAV